MKFLFLGGGDFSVKVLEILLKTGFAPEIVVTTPDKSKGRKMQLQPTPLKTWNLKHETYNIKLLQPEKLDSSFKFQVSSFKPDFAVIAGYGKIIPKEILEIFKYGTLNVHPSLLPKFRGASPIQSFILSGEKETGVTIILTDEQVDHGPILAKSEIQSTKSETYKELEEKLTEMGGKLLVETIPKWLNNEIKPQEQDHSKATFTKKITKQDGLILPTDSPEIIERKVRAFTPWPGAYMFIDNKRLIITEAELIGGKFKIKKIKPENKNEMNFEDYLRGNPNIVIEKYL